MNRIKLRQWSISDLWEAGLGWLALFPWPWFLMMVVGCGLVLVLLSGRGEAGTVLYSFSDGGQVVAAPVQAVTGQVTAPTRVISHGLLRAPTISPTRIDEVLRQYHSPAVGIGQALYDLGVRYGIDPAYALAFFIHESSAGTQGVANVTKSIGNIRCTYGYECYETQGNGSFRRYSSWEAGAEDWYKLIKEVYINKWGLVTLEQIIPVYAPSADRNNPIAYIQQVAGLVESWQM
jgi:hypothetical protein